MKMEKMSLKREKERVKKKKMMRKIWIMMRSF
jgi:hypothetical protein